MKAAGLPGRAAGVDVHCASALDQQARSTWWPNRIFSSMPLSFGVLADVVEDRRRRRWPSASTA